MRLSSSEAVLLAALGCLLFGTASLAQGAACPGVPTDPQIETGPKWESEEHGLAETGLVAVPFDATTGLRDLVVANGNDRFPQPLAIHRNRRYEAGNGWHKKQPDWISQHIEMHGGVSAGDIDKDGFFDVAVAVFADHPPLAHDAGSGYRYKPGGVDIYRGVGKCKNEEPDEDCTNHPALERAPSTRIRQGFGATATSLGDVNGDGWLDVAVAVAYEATRFEMPTHGTPTDPGRLRVYMTKDGKLDVDHPWESDDEYNTGDVELADVNQDGLLDLVAGTDRVLIFFGVRNANGATLEGKPGWDSEVIAAKEEGGSTITAYVVSLDTGSMAWPRPDGAWLHVAVGTACLSSNRSCPGRFAVLAPGAHQTGRTPIWDSLPDFEGWAGEVRLRDRDDDCGVDLVASAWQQWDPMAGATARGSSAALGAVVPSNLRIYAGTGTTLEDSPAWVSNDSYVGQSVEVADFNCKRTKISAETFQVPKTPFTVTLRDSAVERILRARMKTTSGLMVEIPLPAAVIGERHLTFTDLEPSAEVSVEFTRSPLFDMVVGTWEFGKGLRLYLSRANPPYKSCLGEEE